MSRTMLSRTIPRTILGRRPALVLRSRTPARRAGSWAGIGPARDGEIPAVPSSSDAVVHVADGLDAVHLDVPPGRIPATGQLVGVAVHAGPWLLVLTWPRDRVHCRCGHDRDAHQHYRPGSDCGECGPTVCAALTPAGRDTARA